jgi:transcriptional regulator GlxA family with amidase domain
MKHISILVPKRAILGSLEGSRQLLTQVNQFFLAAGKDPIFKVELVGLTMETPVSGGLFTVNANKVIGEVQKTDLIIIPAIDGNISEEVENNKEFLPWLTQQYNNGAEIASLCMGAFLLASTGLLAGKKCATHWMFANEFRKMFPDVNLVTSMFALGRRNLERRFKKATANTVAEYIQRVKIEAAKVSLETSRENVNEVMYNVGYTDTKAFRTTFKRITGLSPIDYRNKYQREYAT